MALSDIIRHFFGMDLRIFNIISTYFIEKMLCGKILLSVNLLFSVWHQIYPFLKSLF